MMAHYVRHAGWQPLAPNDGEVRCSAAPERRRPVERRRPCRARGIKSSGASASAFIGAASGTRAHAPCHVSRQAYSLALVDERTTSQTKGDGRPSGPAAQRQSHDPTRAVVEAADEGAQSGRAVKRWSCDVR
jgi:hypothetical protein